MLTELEEILGRVCEVADAVVLQNAERTDREARWPEENLHALQEAGLGGLVVPRAHGGLGQGLAALARVCEELGRRCPSTALCYGMHHVGAAVLSAKATPEQAQRYLEPIAGGAHLTTLALSEPGSGAQFYLPQTELRWRPEGGFVLSGLKSFVTSGARADSYVVSATTGTESGAGQFSCVVVEAGVPGLSWGPAWSGWGMRGNSSRSLELRGVVIPSEALLGNQGDHIWYVFQVIAPFFIMALAGTYLGCAVAALEEARTSLTLRRHSHSGMTLAQQPIIQHRVGVLWAEVERTRALIERAARLGEAAAPTALAALCSAKAEVAECAVRVINETMTLLGGRAYGGDTRIQRLLRDASAAHLMAPTTEQLRTWAGRAFLGVPLLGD